MKNRFDLLVFDWDGTLIDSIGWIVQCIQHAARKSELEIPGDQAARSVIGLSLQQAMQALYPGFSPEQADRLADHYREYYHTHADDALSLFDGVYAMLVELKSQGYQLAVATGKARGGLDHALSEAGLESMFHATRCSDETASKPDPLMLHEIIDELGVTRERTLLIGDSWHDMRMANNAGVAAVAVGCGANQLDELEAFNPLFSIQSTVELLALLEGTP